MASVFGDFDSDKNPCVEFHLRRAATRARRTRHSGIIDTGFSGFLALPPDFNDSLKLPTRATARFTVADGREVTWVLVEGRVSIGGKTVDSRLIALAPGLRKILIGMDFLRLFKMGLIIRHNEPLVLLQDEEESKAQLQRLLKAHAASRRQSPRKN